MGVDEVARPAAKVNEFLVDSGDAGQKPLSELPLQATEMLKNLDDTIAEHVVGVKWLKTVPLSQANPRDGLRRKPEYRRPPEVVEVAAHGRAVETAVRRDVKLPSFPSGAAW